MFWGKDRQLSHKEYRMPLEIFERSNSVIVLTDGLTTLILTADHYFRTYINICYHVKKFHAV
jgi:hypothetical protein